MRVFAMLSLGPLGGSQNHRVAGAGLHCFHRPWEHLWEDSTVSPDPEMMTGLSHLAPLFFFLSPWTFASADG